MRKIFICVLYMCFFGSVAYAEQGFLVENAKVQKLTSGNKDRFHVIGSDGTGPCNGESIYFKEPAATVSGDEKSIERSYSLILSAYMSNKRIGIWGESTADCGSAYSVEIWAQ